MTQTIEPNAGRHPATQLTLGLWIMSSADSPYHLRIAQRDVHQHTFYV
jgi:hypothetical protein